MWKFCSQVYNFSNCQVYQLSFRFQRENNLQDTSRNNGGNTPCTIFTHSNLIIQQPFSFYGINFAGDINCYWIIPLELYIAEAFPHKTGSILYFRLAFTVEGAPTSEFKNVRMVQFHLNFVPIQFLSSTYYPLSKICFVR